MTDNINPNTACVAYTPEHAYFENEYIVEKTETKSGWSFPASDEDMITGYPEELRDFIGAIAEGRAPRSGILLAADEYLEQEGAQANRAALATDVQTLRRMLASPAAKPRAARA